MKESENKLDLKKQYFLYMILASFFVLGVGHSIVNALVFLLLSLYIICEKNHSKTINLLVFIAPLTSIFKISADGAALYTYLTLVFILKMLIMKSISKKFIFVYFFFVIYCICGIGNGYAAVLRILTIPLLLYYFLNPNENIDRISIIKIFIFSLIIANFIGYFKSYLPNMTNFIVDKSLRIERGVYSNRFSGLNGDPNYYSVNMLLGLALILYLLIKKEMKINKGVFLIILLIFFGAQTNSKTFLLTLVGIFALTIYALFKNKRYFFGFLFMFVIIIFAFLTISGKIPIFNTVFNRLKSDTSISDLTTKRSDIAISYFNFFNSNPIVYFFGNGFNSGLINNKVPHNTYIDFIYNFGILGSILFLYVVLFNTRFYKKEKNISNYIPLAIILICYISLSELKYYDFPMHLFLVILLIIGEKKQKIDKNYIKTTENEYVENKI